MQSTWSRVRGDFMILPGEEEGERGAGGRERNHILKRYGAKSLPALCISTQKIYIIQGIYKKSHLFDSENVMVIAKLFHRKIYNVHVYVENSTYNLDNIRRIK